MPETPERQSPSQHPPHQAAQMYDRPANADRPPLGRLILIAVALLLAAVLVAKFAFHVHFGPLLHAGH